MKQPRVALYIILGALVGAALAMAAMKLSEKRTDRNGAAQRNADRAAVQWLELSAVTKGKRQMSTTLRSSETCDSSDIDMMLYRLGQDGKPPLLLTLEPIGAAGDAAPAFSRVFQVEDVQRSRNFEIALPPGTGPWGVYLCSDVAKTGRCQGKPSVRELIGAAGMVPGSKGKSGGKADDALLFFAPVVLQRERVGILRSYPLHTDLADGLRAVLTDQGLSDGRADEIVKLSRRLLSRVSSVPLGRRGDELTIYLPKHSDEGCVSSRMGMPTVKAPPIRIPDMPLMIPGPGPSSGAAWREITTGARAGEAAVSEGYLRSLRVFLSADFGAQAAHN